MPTNIFSLPTEINASLTIGGTDNVAVTSTGNVGIGTTSPTQKLDVVGNIAAQYDANNYSRLGSSSSGGYIQSYSGGAEKIMLRSYGDSFFNAGNVGIGTTSPGSTLHVDGTVRFVNSGFAGFEAHNTNGTWESFIGTETGGGGNRYNSASSQHTFYNNSTAVMRIDSSGNVGIGTTSPAKKLDVRGGYFITSDGGTNEEAFVQGGNGYAYFGNYSTGKAAFGNSENWTTLVADGGNIGIGTTSPNYKLDVNGEAQLGYINFEYNSNYAGIRWKDSAYNLQWKLGHDGPSGNWLYLYDYGMSASAFTFKPNGDMLFTPGGNVGIGTTSPGAFSGTVFSSPILDLSGSFNIRGLSADGNSVLNMGGDTYRKAAIYTSIGTNSPYLAFATSASGSASSTVEAIRIDASQNVGIGTTSPSAKLDVDGVVSLKTGTNSAYSIGVLEITSGGTPTQIKITTAIPFSGTTNAHSVTIKGFQYGSANTANLQISWHVYNNSFYNRTATSSGGWSPTIRLAVENGYVVIHLASPGYWPKLYVESLYNAFGGTSHAQGWSWADAAISSDTNTPNEVVPYKVNFGNSFAMDSSGNVGIGTTSPSSRLHVYGGDIRLDNGAGDGFLKDSSGNNRLYFGTGTYLNSNTGGPVAFQVAGSEKMRVNSDGNVGIGTTSPSAKLDIAGNLQVKNGDLGSVAGDSVKHAIIRGARHYLDFKEVRTANGTDWMNTTYKLQMRVDSTNHQSIDFVSDSNALEHIDILTGNQQFNTRFTYDGKVGIGTTSPDTLLHIESGSSASSPIFTIENDNDIKLKLGSVRSAGGTAPDTTFIAYDGHLRFIADADSTTEVVRIDSSGNVGIGTTSPGAKLTIVSGGKGIHVDKGSHSSTSANLSECRTNYAFAYDTLRNGSTTGFFITNVGTNTPAMQAVDSSNNAQDISIQPYGGNVGIGTTSPEGLLHVKASDTTAVIKIEGGNSVVTANGEINSRLEFGSNDGSVNSSGNVGGSIASVTENPNGAITGLAFSTFYQGRTPNDLAEAMRITGDGNVGIGTTSPASKLTIYSETHTDDIRMLATNGGTTNSYLGNFAGGTYLATNYYYNGSQNSDDATKASMEIYLGQDNFQLAHMAAGSAGTRSPRIYVDSSGNVGIGTASPGGKLDIRKAQSTTAFTSPFLKLFPSATTNTTGLTSITLGTSPVDNYGVSLSGWRYGTDGTPKFIIKMHNNSASGLDALTVDSSGNVGIGTTSPVHKLHVDSGSIQLRDKVFYSASGNDTGSGTANGFAATLNDYHGTTLESQWTYKISITTTGTGTYNSSSYIVYRNSADTAWVSREISRSGTSSNHPELTISGNNAIIYDDHTSTYTVRYTVESRYTGQSKTSPHIMGSDYHWQRTGSDLYYTDGNVGIGTTSPSEKLHVDGGMILVGTDTGDAFNASALVGIQGTNAAYFQAKSSTTGFAGLLLGDTDDDYHAGMIYSNSTSILTFNAGNSTRLSIDGTSGNVGIGTTSPPSTVLLDLKENTSAADLIIGLTAATGGRSQIRSVAQADNTTSEISFHTVASSSTSEAMRIASNGNVGIGTTSPAYKLDVNGDIGIGSSSKLVFDDNNSVGQSYVKSGGDLNLIIDSNNNQNVAALIVEKDTQTAGSGTELFRVQENGNVGIGTTSPSAKLNVAGNAIIGDGVSRATSGLTVGYSRSTAYTANSDLGDANRAVTIINNQDNTANTYATLGFRVSPATSTSMGDFKFVRTAANENSLIWTARHGTSWYDRFTIKSDGNVGIGKTSPSAPLNVFSSSVTDIAIFENNASSIAFKVGDSSNTSYANYVLTTNSGNAQIFKAGSAYSSFGGAASLNIYNSNGAIALHPNGISNAVFINTSGNVGIGTSSPGAKLEVSDTTTGIGAVIGNTTHNSRLQIYTAAVGKNSEIWFGDAADDDIGKIDYDHANNSLSFFTNTAEAMRIDTSGNVGIGTTSPAYTLDVAGGVFSSNHFTTDSGQLLSIYQSSWTGNENHYVLYNAWTSGTGDYLLAKSSGNQAGTNGAVLIADGSGGRTFFGRHGNTSTAIDSSTAPLDETYAYIGATGTYFGSDVGIGTTSPSQKLEVAGTIRGEVVNVYGSTNPASTSPYLFSPATGALGIGANGSERMRIANNGRVGIGTTNPTAILTLTGTLNDNWAGRFENTNTGGYGMLVITAGSTANERVFEARRNTSTSALMVKADGNVGINDSTPSYTLDVNGTIRATGDVIEFSDARVKENVETVSNALDKVKAMRGVGYNKIGSEKRSVGVIAQEMLEVLPEVVHQDSDGMYSVAYGNLVGVLIEAMKEQQAQIDELKAMLNTDA